MSCSIVFGAAGEGMNGAVDLYGQARFAYGKVHGVAANLVLSNHMHAFLAQQTQNLPGTFFAGTHAAASRGCAKARRMSQAPSRIIGIDSSMPMVR